jgi:hypothetical protein
MSSGVFQQPLSTCMCTEPGHSAARVRSTCSKAFSLLISMNALIFYPQNEVSIKLTASALRNNSSPVPCPPPVRWCGRTPVRCTQSAQVASLRQRPPEDMVSRRNKTLSSLKGTPLLRMEDPQTKNQSTNSGHSFTPDQRRVENVLTNSSKRHALPGAMGHSPGPVICEATKQVLNLRRL